jgi:hypothetical protein
MEAYPVERDMMIKISKLNFIYRFIIDQFNNNNSTFLKHFIKIKG